MLMLQCWKFKPSERPAFAELLARIKGGGRTATKPLSAAAKVIEGASGYMEDVQAEPRPQLQAYHQAQSWQPFAGYRGAPQSAMIAPGNYGVLPQQAGLHYMMMGEMEWGMTVFSWLFSRPGTGGDHGLAAGTDADADDAAARRCNATVDDAADDGASAAAAAAGRRQARRLPGGAGMSEFELGLRITPPKL